MKSTVFAGCRQIVREAPDARLVAPPKQVQRGTDRFDVLEPNQQAPGLAADDHAMHPVADPEVRDRPLRPA